jgi:hypothetical protein
VNTGAHTIVIDKLEPYEQTDILLRGVGMYYLPCGITGTAESVYKTYEIFNGTNLQASNAEFMAYKMNWTMVPYGKQQVIDRSLIRSGDYLAIMRLDGLDPMISASNLVFGPSVAAHIVQLGSVRHWWPHRPQRCGRLGRR